MKAVYLPQFKKETTLELTGNDAHHFINVFRIRVEEKILILDGEGSLYYYEVDAVLKKNLSLSFIKEERKEPGLELSIALPLLKKESMELALRHCVEMGVRHIYPVLTDYSQPKFLKSERVEKIIKSAVEQSNCYFAPKVYSVKKITEVFNQAFDHTFIMSLRNGSTDSNESISLKSSVLLVLGPEGGLSDLEETQFIMQAKRVQTLNFKTPIQRASTAVVSGITAILAKAQ